MRRVLLDRIGRGGDGRPEIAGRLRAGPDGLGYPCATPGLTSPLRSEVAALSMAIPRGPAGESLAA